MRSHLKGSFKFRFVRVLNLRYLRLILRVVVCVNIESALSAVPFERVIEVEGCLSIESALSAFDI